MPAVSNAAPQLPWPCCRQQASVRLEQHTTCLIWCARIPLGRWLQALCATTWQAFQCGAADWPPTDRDQYHLLALLAEWAPAAVATSTELQGRLAKAVQTEMGVGRPFEVSTWHLTAPAAPGRGIGPGWRLPALHADSRACAMLRAARCMEGVSRRP